MNIFYFHDISLQEVLSNPDFFKDVGKKNWFYSNKKRMEDEAHRLHFGIHLMRVELFRIRGLKVGFNERFIKSKLPRYFPLVDINWRIHQSLLSQSEYLRADLILLAANYTNSRPRGSRQ